jgi:hypothetical protein
MDNWSLGLRQSLPAGTDIQLDRPNASFLVRRLAT